MNSSLQPLQPPSVAVRSATTSDLDALVPLFDAYRQFYGQPTDAALARRFLAARLARSEAHVLLATQGSNAMEAPLGFAQLYPMHSSIQCRRTLVLNDLYVAPAHRQQGLAWALLDHARRLAALMGAASLSLQTSPSNHQARRLYERFGFVRDDQFLTYCLSLS